MTDPFSPLKKVSERERRGLDQKDLEGELKEILGFIAIPAEAFISISNLPEYKYLQSGLYVARKKLQIETVQFDSKGQKLICGPKGEYIAQMNWFEAKKWAKDLGGKMLTPAEYCCIVEWLRPMESEKGTLEDLMYAQEEWLDGMMKDGRLYTHTDVSEREFSGGHSRERPMKQDIRNYFDLKDCDTATGLPPIVDPFDGEFFYACGAPGEGGILRTTVEDNSISRATAVSPCIMKVPGPNSTYEKTCIRVCYTKEQMEKNDRLRWNE